MCVFTIQYRAILHEYLLISNQAKKKKLYEMKYINLRTPPLYIYTQKKPDFSQLYIEEEKQNK